MMKKSLAALALSIVLAVGMMPAIALAADGGGLTTGSALTTQTTPDLSYEGVRVVGGSAFYGTPQTITFEARSDVANYNEPDDDPWNYGDFTLYKGDEIIATKRIYFWSESWLKGEFITWEVNVSDVGNYHVTFRGHGLSMTGKLFTASFTVEKGKKDNPMTVKAKKVSLSASKVKKKAQSVQASKAFTVKKSQGKVTYKATADVTKNARSKVKVASDGTVTAKKGTKKGAYKLKVEVTATGNATYKSGSKTVTLTVVVK